MSEPRRPRVLASLLLAAFAAAAAWSAVALAASPRCDRPAHAILSVYEWRADQWRNVEQYAEVVHELEHRCVRRIYVEATGVVAASAAERQEFVDDLLALSSAADELGVEIGVVAGDPWWFASEGLTDTGQVLAVVAQAQRQASEQDRAGVVAIHLDVEPWGLPQEWANDAPVLAAQWLDMIETTQANAADLGLDVPLAWLVPAWFDGSAPDLPATERDGEVDSVFGHAWQLLEPQNTMVVMAYRNGAAGPDGIVALATTEAERSSGAALLAVETVAVEPAKITFAASDLAAMLAELHDVVDQLGVSEVAINDVEAK